jgi:hypothetical protein
MQFLKQSTAATVEVGPVLDADGNAYTSAVIGDFNITKNGTTAALAAAATATHSHNGTYLVALTTGNTDTLGRLSISMNKATYGMTIFRYDVLAANQFDAIVTNGNVTPAAIADAVWDEAYSGHTTAGTFGKLMDILRKSNNVIEGTILASPTPTTTVFRISGANYPTGALEHSVLWMNSGASQEQNSPILTTVNNGDATLTITLEEALTTAPVAGDTVLIDPTSHVHAIADIASGIWSVASSAYSAATGTMGLIMYAFSQMLELVSVWRWKATALSQAPAGGGGGGDATEAKQDQIISLIQGSEVLTVATPNVNGNLVLTQGDTYDGAAGGNAKATWTVSTDYRTDWAVRLTIRDKDDAVVYTNTGTVDSATSVSVAIVVPTVSPFAGCPGVWQGKYDVQLTKSGSIKTIAMGVVYVNEDQTR